MSFAIRYQILDCWILCFDPIYKISDQTEPGKPVESDRATGIGATLTGSW
jgi:hypothetical protein